VREALDKLNIDPRDFVFVDFGSGKGRVLLIAATLPFKSVVGIEFSVELHETAVRNIARFPRELIRTATVTSRCKDPATYSLPAANLVCYFHNPFGPPILSQIVQRLEAHCAKGYRVLVVYLDPRHRALFEASASFAVLDETRSTLLLTTARERML
jgi:SAM-dependent methyltransferase